MAPLKIMRMSEAGEEDRALLSPSKLEEERIEREFFEARNSNDDERLRKAWTEYRKLWIQDGIFQAD